MSSKKHNILALIPARGGSKRIPRKNLLDFNGEPLIAWTIKAAKGSKFIEKIVVSSDDKEILSISKKLGVDYIERPNELSLDTSKTIDVVVHTLSSFEKYDYLILLQPTSPLRTTKHIDEAIELLLDNNYDGVISVTEMEHSPLWSGKLKENLSMKNFIKKDILNKRSQDLEKYYRLNGAIYICRIDKLIKEKTFFLENNVYAYIMKKEESVDIDEYLDFQIASFLHQRLTE